MKRILTLSIAIMAVSALSASAADAKATYEKDCAKCHGADGKGETKMGKKHGAKDYTDAKVQAELKDDAAIKAIKEGYKDKDGKQRDEARRRPVRRRDQRPRRLHAEVQEVSATPAGARAPPGMRIPLRISPASCPARPDGEHGVPVAEPLRADLSSYRPNANQQPPAMSSESAPTPAPVRRSSVFRNWLSLTGLVVVVGSLFSFFLLLLLDALAHFANPYVGILTYLVAPGFLVIGLFLALLGAFLRHRQILKTSGPLPPLRIDLTRPRDRRLFGFFLAGSVLFLLISALGTYQTYHFTESVQFCGQACHGVMKPEYVTYRNGPHARVACAECHIGKGANWYVRSKLSGTYQVYATMADKYPRPIPTPVKNLRPAQETCEECHWPKKFVGNLERTFTHFLSDETNTPFTVRMLLKVGGGDPTHGPVGGIHWHMNVGNKIEYIASDEARQKIP